MQAHRDNAHRVTTAASRLAGVAALLVLVACGSDVSDPPLESQLLAALPTSGVLDVGVPESSVASKPGAASNASALKASGFFESTRTVGQDLNKLLRVVMTPISKVVRGAVKASASKRRSWTADDVEGRTLLAAEAHEDGHISYSVAVRPPAGGAFLPFVVGSATPNDGGGQGAVWVDFNNDVSAATSGQVLVLYDFDLTGGDDLGPERTITVYTYDLEHPVLSGKKLASAMNGRTGVYHFAGSRREGVMVYDATDVDVAAEVATPGKGNGTLMIIPSTIVSRWTDTGGRSDAYILVPPKSAPLGEYVRVRASQCWDRPGFARRFSETVAQKADGSFATIGTTGVLSDCVYSTPAPAVLPDVAPAPPPPTLPPEAV